jgi:flagellum-specific ATP synthase
MHSLFDRLRSFSPIQTYGKVHRIVGLVVEGSCPRSSIGSLCEISPLEEGDAIPAEIVGYSNNRALLMPLGELRGLGPGSRIRVKKEQVTISVGDALLGRVLDGMGRPLDEGPPMYLPHEKPLYSLPPDPMHRVAITRPLDLGIRAINSLLTCGIGQRMGIMAGSGVGKSTLMGMMARYTSAEVNVIGLIGERGREVLEFIEKDLGATGMARSVVVVATSDQSPLVRMRAAYAATAVAEYFRDHGLDVLLMMDSITRFAMAAREVGLAVGEPPTTKGYTPTVFSQLPKLLERAGRSDRGTITGVYTVLVDGDDFNEPIADAVRSILDGHIVLTRDLADQGHFPAIDVLRSISRLRADICSQESIRDGQVLLRHLATYRKVEDMINIGAYAQGSNQDIDRAIAMVPRINEFLRQDVAENQPFAVCEEKMTALAQQG